MKIIIERLNRAPKSLILFVSLFLLGAVAGFDFITGHEVSFSIFYLFPIAIVTMFIGTAEGILLSTVCAVLWLINDWSSNPEYSSSFVYFWNSAVRLGFFLITALLLSALKKQMQFARTDFLTGIPNRRGLIDSGARELEMSRRYNYTLTIVYVDINNFKKINDTFGHHVGDIALQKIAASISRSIRMTDTVARIGGDEFVILLPRTELEYAKEITQRIKENLLEEMKANGWYIILSMGIITFHRIPKTIDDAIKQVDEMLYTSKKEGKDTVKVID